PGCGRCRQRREGPELDAEGAFLGVREREVAGEADGRRDLVRAVRPERDPLPQYAVGGRGVDADTGRARADAEARPAAGIDHALPHGAAVGAAGGIDPQVAPATPDPAEVDGPDRGAPAGGLLLGTE